MKFVLDPLKNFHKNVKFTFEEEIDEKIPFLDTVLVRNNHYIDTGIYRKKTNTYIYVNRNSFESNSWKWGTPKTLVTRPFEICSTDKFLEEEIEYVRAVFYHQNIYPLLVIDNITHKMKGKPTVTKVVNDERGDITATIQR